jgi:hypothetical protein
VDIASAIPAGDNNIGNVDIASALPAGDNNIGNVDLASAIPAGTNLIGKVSIDQTTPGTTNGVQLKNSSAVGAAAVTPSDTTDLTTAPTKGLYIGGSGNVKVDMSDGTTVTFTDLAAGVIHPISCKRVYATDTTATLILAVY